MSPIADASEPVGAGACCATGSRYGAAEAATRSEGSDNDNAKGEENESDKTNDRSNESKNDGSEQGKNEETEQEEGSNERKEQQKNGEVDALALPVLAPAGRCPASPVAKS